MKKRLTAGLLSASLSIILSVSACSGGASTTTTSVDSVTIGQVAEPTSVPDPIIDGSLAGYSYYYNLFDSLTRLDPDGKIVPWLATEWSSNKDFTEWTFELRDDVTFSNGDPLTADDVEFTFDTILNTPDSDPLTYLAPLKGVEATDPTTVVFELKEPFSSFPSLVTAAAIVPEKVYTELGSDGFAKAPVGSGQYEFVSWTPGVDYVLERNQDYWGEPAPYDRLTFQTVADEDARLNGVVSGSLNVALVAPNQVDSLQGGTVDVENVPSNGVTFLGMNSTSGPLGDELVRKAIELAIDKEALTSSVLDGRASVAHEAIAPGVGGYDPSVEPSAYDPEQARELLEEAGYDGEPIPFEYATDGRIPLSGEIAQAIQGMLDEVGVKVDLQGMDQATLSDRIYGTENMKGIYLNTYAPSQMDGDPVIEDFFAGGSNDYAELPETAKLVDETRRVSGQERIDVYGELMRYNAEHALIIPLYVPDTSFISTSGMDWEARTDGLFYFGKKIG